MKKSIFEFQVYRPPNNWKWQCWISQFLIQNSSFFINLTMGRKCRREYIWISNYKTCYKCSCVYWIDRLSQKRNTRNPKFQCFKVWTLPINAPKCLKFWQSILRARRQKLICKNITNMSNALFSDDKLLISRNICVLHSAFNMLSC